MRSVLDQFQSAVNARDANLIGPLLADDVTLHASVSVDPFEGKAAVLVVFSMLIELFEDCRFTHEFAGPDGLALLTQGVVAGHQADGMQVLTFNADGLVMDFRDFVRPLTALTALKDAATAFLAKDSGG
jgi:hypothetical protein